MADAAGDLLIDRHDGCRDRGAQGVILVPSLDCALDAVPLEDVLVRVLNHAGLQRNQRIRNLEGRSRQLRLARAILVAGDDQVIIDKIADESAFRAVIGKMPGQRLANFALLVGDIGKAARRQKACSSQKTERMTAINHGVHPKMVSEAREDAGDIVVKR